MNYRLKESHLNGPGKMNARRWNELKYFANVSIDILGFLMMKALTFIFLNRGTKRNVKTKVDLDEIFAEKPNGIPPITSGLYRKKKATNYNRQFSNLICLFISNFNSNSNSQIENSYRW
jgi:hypothetical protein